MRNLNPESHSIAVDSDLRIGVHLYNKTIRLYSDMNESGEPIIVYDDDIDNLIAALQQAKQLLQEAP